LAKVALHKVQIIHRNNVVVRRTITPLRNPLTRRKLMQPEM